MGLQSNWNNGMMGLAMLGAVSQVSQAIRDAGFNDYNQLVAAINELEIKIAEAKDAGTNYSEMERLLQKYRDLRAQADQEEADRKKKRTIGFVVGCVIALLAMIVTYSWVFSQI